MSTLEHQSVKNGESLEHLMAIANRGRGFLWAVLTFGGIFMGSLGYLLALVTGGK